MKLFFYLLRLRGRRVTWYGCGGCLLATQHDNETLKRDRQRSEGIMIDFETFNSLSSIPRDAFFACTRNKIYNCCDSAILRVEF